MKNSFATPASPEPVPELAVIGGVSAGVATPPSFCVVDDPPLAPVQRFSNLPVGGNYPTLYLRCVFADQAEPPITSDQAKSLTDEVASFYTRESRGTVNFSFTVPEVAIQMSQSTSYYESQDGSQVLNEAEQIAAAMASQYPALNPSGYLRIICHYQCKYPYAGRVQLFGSEIEINGTTQAYIIAHEIGHTFGLQHANEHKGLFDPADPIGTEIEYGDHYDIMGIDNDYLALSETSREFLHWNQPGDSIAITNNTNVLLTRSDQGCKAAFIQSSQHRILVEPNHNPLDLSGARPSVIVRLQQTGSDRSCTVPIDISSGLPLIRAGENQDLILQGWNIAVDATDNEDLINVTFSQIPKRSRFELWAAANHTSADADYDPDEDGNSNLQEYAFGTDPNDSQSRPGVYFRTTPGTTVVHNQAEEIESIPPRAYYSAMAAEQFTGELVIQTSSDLANWNDSAMVAIYRKGERHYVSLVSTQVPMLFYRIKIVPLDP